MAKKIAQPQKSPQELVEIDRKKRGEELAKVLNEAQERLRARLVPILTVDGKGQVTGGFRIEVE